MFFVGCTCSPSRNGRVAGGWNGAPYGEPGARVSFPSDPIRNDSNSLENGGMNGGRPGAGNGRANKLSPNRNFPSFDTRACAGDDPAGNCTLDPEIFDRAPLEPTLNAVMFGNEPVVWPGAWSPWFTTYSLLPAKPRLTGWTPLDLNGAPG